MLNAKQNELLMQAVELLHEADCLVQKALGASDECYELHCAIENAAEDVLEHIQTNNKVDTDA